MQRIGAIFTSIFILLFSISVSAQQKQYSINGTIKDKASGETLIGASVQLLGKPGYGTVSNTYGFYSLYAPSGTYTMLVRFTGYVADSIEVVLDKNVTQVVELEVEKSSLEAVTVTAQKSNNVSEPIMGVQKLSVSEIQNVPVIFGEKDVIKTIQLLPGIKSAGEGSSGFFVRGGSADQNLILLDEATVYNASHLLGFFSSFNSDAIKDLTLYKGAMPANFGGRLSSVVDITMNDGNDQKFHGNGGLGLIASRFTAEGPIVPDKGSYIISGRRSYADLFLKMSNDSSINNNTLYFYDLNVKANYTLNQNNRLFLSGYFGKDKIGIGGQFGIDYGNTTATARWNHVFNGRLFSNTSFIYSDYNYNIHIESGANDLVIKSKIEDLALKEDFQYYVNNHNKWNFGFNVIHHSINPGVVDASSTSSFNSQTLQDRYSLESAFYLSNDLTPTSNLKINYGLRMSAFSVLGPGTYYSYDAEGNTSDSSSYGTGKIVKTYLKLEPRFSASLKLNQVSSLKASYSRNVQNLHLLSNSASTNPTDLWIGSSPNVKPEIADQVSMGYYRDFDNGKYEFSSEIYYKLLWNQIDYKDGAELRANENVESQLLFGKGRAYGLELFLKKKIGRLTGWVSYTLSKSERKIDGINNFEWYDAKQDQTHNIAIVGMYKFNKKWSFSGNWVYNTGNAVTFPSGKYGLNGQTIFYYTNRNAYRMPAYHRMDLSATLEGKQKEHWQSSWTFSIYNVYGRENAYSIQFENDPGDASKTRAVQTTLFRWIPSVTYNFKF